MVTDVELTKLGKTSRHFPAVRIFLTRCGDIFPSMFVQIKPGIYSKTFGCESCNQPLSLIGPTFE